MIENFEVGEGEGKGKGMVEGDNTLEGQSLPWQVDLTFLSFKIKNGLKGMEWNV